MHPLFGCLLLHCAIGYWKDEDCQIWMACHRKVRRKQIKTSPNAQNQWKPEMGLRFYNDNFLRFGNFSKWRGKGFCFKEWGKGKRVRISPKCAE